MNPYTSFSSHAVLLPINDVDTDQIIPARFLKATGQDGLGAHLFSNWRYLADGRPNEAFVLNQPSAIGSEILVAGHNFGCGSSREHAPWALRGWGFRAVIATSFADIFRNNALKNGLLPATLSEADYPRVVAMHTANPAMKFSIDLVAQTIGLPDGSSLSFPIDAFAKRCLLEGTDELGVLLSMDAAIRAFENAEAR